MEFRKNDELSRYELLDDGLVVAIADYRGQPGTVVLPHTETLQSRRGEGLAAELVRQALDDVRSTGARVVPACWYVADFIRDNPEYADLLAA